jgi:hypothetical protein
VEAAVVVVVEPPVEELAVVVLEPPVAVAAEWEQAELAQASDPESVRIRAKRLIGAVFVRGVRPSMGIPIRRSHMPLA